MRSETADPVGAVVGDVLACPMCGWRAEPAGPVAGGTRCIDDPALTMPAQRLVALAAEVGITVRSVPPEHGRRFGAAVALLPIPEDEPDTCVWIADDLAQDLHADVLAFAIALSAETDLILAAVDGILGVGRDRLPPAEGVAMRRGTYCGRVGADRRPRPSRLSRSGFHDRPSSHLRAASARLAVVERGAAMTGDWAAVAAAINHRMAELGLRQQDLVERSRVSKTAVHEIRRNTVQRRRSARTLEAVSVALIWHPQHLAAVLERRTPPKLDDPVMGSNGDVSERLASIERRMIEIFGRLDTISADLSMVADLSDRRKSCEGGRQNDRSGHDSLLDAHEPGL